MTGSQPTSDPYPPMPEESPITLLVNGQTLATVQATRVALKEWAYGFLRAEGLIQNPREVIRFLPAEDGSRLDVQLAGPFPKALTCRYLNGWGPTLPVATPGEDESPVLSQVEATHAQLARYQARMHGAAALYQATGGTHVAGLFRTSDDAMLVCEDVGRHNAVDKVIGAALLAGWEASDLALLTSGRISAAMIGKAIRFGVGLIASRSAATDQAVRLGEQAGVTLIGYLRPHSLRLYTGAHRLVDEEQPAGAGPVDSLLSDHAAIIYKE